MSRRRHPRHHDHADFCFDDDARDRELADLRSHAIGPLERDKAEIVFGQQVIETCRADAAAILAARRTAIGKLESADWDAAAFHRELRRAWVRVRAETGSEWIELADVLPEVAMLLQPRPFRADPTQRKFQAYPKAKFLFDLWRLRRDRSLAVEGWRLSLGPATGGSTKDKQRVFFIEDSLGEGQYSLTLRFVREEIAR